MAGRECYHCKQWVDEGEAHDCWTTTETALTRDLSEDLQDAWERLREAAVALGEQRIYASHSSIMFSRKSCHFFVRPKKSFLEFCVFLGRPAERATGAARRSRLEVQGGAPHPNQASGRGRGPADRLDAGGVRPVGCSGHEGRHRRTLAPRRSQPRGARRRARRKPCGSAATLERRSAARALDVRPAAALATSPRTPAAAASGRASPSEASRSSLVTT